MLKKWMNVAPLALLISCSSICHSQALPTATAKGALQVGIGWTYGRPDFGTNTIQGVTAFADFDFRAHLGVEAEFHYLSLITPGDLGENSFFVGPRFILPRGRFAIYGKPLIGVGNTAIQNVNDTIGAIPGNHFAYGAGGGVDYRVVRHLVARADYEYQHWSYPPHGLTPTAFTIGAAYRFH